MGNLGHFLTPTSVTWLPGNGRFVVGYREHVCSIFDVQSGNEVEDFSFASDMSSANGSGTRQTR